MGKEYAVLWGARGVKEGFENPAKAREFAKRKAYELGEKVEIDVLQDYPSGEDYSQRHHSFVKPPKQAPKKRDPFESLLDGEGIHL